MRKTIGIILALATLLVILCLSGNVQAATDIRNQFDESFVNAVCDYNNCSL